MAHPVLEEGAQALGPGGGGGGDHDPEVGVMIEEMLDEGRGGLGLPHRDGVNPEPGGHWPVTIAA